MSSSETYKHAINVNIGGTGKRPVVSLWCGDCLTVVQEFDQINPWDDLRLAVDEHCSRMSERERLMGPDTNEEADRGR